MFQPGHGGLEDFAGVRLHRIVFFHVAIHIRRAVGQTLRQMQFKIGKAFGIQPAAEAVNRGFADLGHAGEGGDTGVDGCLRRRKNDFRHFSFRFAQQFQMTLDFFQHIHMTTTIYGILDFSQR